MSWAALMRLIADEAGPELAARIARRAQRELGGVRLTVCVRAPLDPATIDAVAPGRPREAAAALGVHQSTVYRALRRPLVR